MTGSFSVARSIRIAAPPTAIWPHLVGLRGWERWSPWDRLDPHVEREYSGPDEGVGALSRWRGNRRAGRGEIAIVEAEPPHEIVAAARFRRPRRTASTTTLTLTAHDGETDVYWALTGELNLVSRIAGRIRPIDRVVGRDLESGLQNLRRLVEDARPNS